MLTYGGVGICGAKWIYTMQALAVEFHADADFAVLMAVSHTLLRTFVYVYLLGNIRIFTGNVLRRRIFYLLRHISYYSPVVNML